MEKYSPDEKILLAMYAEWLKDIPDMDRVNQNTMEMDPLCFLWGLIKLKTMGYIDGVSWQPPEANDPRKVVVLSRDFLMLTKDGVEKAQEIAGTAKEKRSVAFQRVYEIFRDIGVETFSSLIGKYIGL